MQDSSKALAALEAYYALGPSRSLRQLAEQPPRGKRSAKARRKYSLRQLEEWSAAFDWQVRVAERDRLQAEANAEAQRQRIAEIMGKGYTTRNDRTASWTSAPRPKPQPRRPPADTGPARLSLLLASFSRQVTPASLNSWLPVLAYNSAIMARSTVALPFDANKLVELCRKNDVKRVGVFGSMARGEANEHSDIDLLVEFSRRKSLLALAALERKISTALGRKVDLLTEAAISPYLRDRIKRDLRVIYDKRILAELTG